MSSERTAEQSAQKSASLLERLNLSERSWKFYAAASIPPIVAASLAYLYYSSSPTKDDKKKGKRKAKKSKKSIKAADDSTAASSSTTTAAADTAAATVSSPADKTAASVGDDSEESPENMSNDMIATLDKASKKKLAQSLKSRGNKFFQAKRYPKAIELYTQALRFDKDPVFYSNRAACYAADNDYDQVIADCTSALELEPRYIKALMRRAQANESTERYRDSLYDFTTACILEDFNNTLAATSAERVLKKLAEAEAHERIEKRDPRLPSKSFISGYLNSFRSCGDEAVAADGENLGEADALYNEALSFIALQEYAKGIASVDKAVATIDEAGTVDGVQRADDIYSLSGMFSFLKSNLDLSATHLDKALEINPKHVRSLLRKANLYTEKRDLDMVSQLLDRACESEPENAEAFFQKGQVDFLKQDFAEAAKNYERAAGLDPDFVYPRIQLGVVQFKIGKMTDALATFKDAMERFPTRSDLYNYYGEVLAEQGGPDDAIAAFEKAVELDKANPLPYVNQAIAVFQSSGNADKALTLIQEALK
ncbi:TOM (translocase of outer membrane) complex component, partial [Coemansia aciculifera]